jgi:hypothetical protein
LPMRRLRWALAAVGLAVLITAGAFALWPRPDRVTLENFRCIHVGMTRGEVEGILGGPPGDYTTGPVVRIQLGDRVGYPDRWVGDHAVIEVRFSNSHEGKRFDWVTDSIFEYARPIEQTPFERFVWRLKRQWHRRFPEK